MAGKISAVLAALAFALTMLLIQIGEASDNIPCNKNIKSDWSDCGSDRGLCCPIGDGD